MATDFANTAQSGMREQVDALRQRGVLSPRSIRRSGLGRLSGSAERSEYGRDQAQGSDAFTFGPGPRSAAEAGWLHSDEGRNRPGEVGAAHQDLARAHQADDRTEQAFNRFQSQNPRYGSTSRDGQRLGRDESSLRNHGSVSHSHIDDLAQQSKSGMYGKVSSGGSAGAERGMTANAINENRNSRQYPAEAPIRDSNRNTTLRDGEHWLNRFATPRQVRRSSAVETHLGMENWYGGPLSRQESL